MPEGMTAMARHRNGWRGAELDREALYWDFTPAHLAAIDESVRCHGSRNRRIARSKIGGSRHTSRKSQRGKADAEKDSTLHHDLPDL